MCGFSGPSCDCGVKAKEAKLNKRNKKVDINERLIRLIRAVNAFSLILTHYVLWVCSYSRIVLGQSAQSFTVITRMLHT